MTSSVSGPAEMEGEGPWEVRWRWSTGLQGTDRFRTAERAITFCDEAWRRTDPPELDISIAVRNTVTGEGLRDYLVGRHGDVPNSVLEDASGRWHAPSMAKCGTCDGTGRIPIIQTGGTKKCTRCNGTGEE